MINGIEKCGKADCVDFDIQTEEEDVSGACGACQQNRRNPYWTTAPDNYHKVCNIVDPTADIEAESNSLDIPPPVGNFIEEQTEISEEVCEALSNTPLAPGWSPNGAQLDVLMTELHPEDIPPQKKEYTIREGLKHNEAPKDIKDSGSRTEFETGAVRDAQGGKGRFDLTPKMALWALAHHYEKGCQKYGDRNWEKGVPIQNFLDSGARHATEFELGLQDENHLIATIWNYVCAYETLLRIDLGILPKSLDTLPYLLRGVIKNSEEVLPWERMRHPLQEVKPGNPSD